MGRYAVTHSAAAGTDKPIIDLKGSATIRCHLYEFTLGAEAAADQTGLFVIERTTDAGTTPAAALTVEPLDPLGSAAAGTANGGGYATPPADGDELYQFGLHQRATFRWVASPGSEFVTVTTAANGIMLNCESYSSGTPNISSTFLWYE